MGIGAGKFLLQQGLGDSAPSVRTLDFPYLLEDGTPGPTIPVKSFSLSSPPSFFLVASGLAYRAREMRIPPAAPTILFSSTLGDPSAPSLKIPVMQWKLKLP